MPINWKRFLRIVKIVTLVIMLLIVFDGFRNPRSQIVTRGMVHVIGLYQRYISGVFFRDAKICKYAPT